ncbi:putative beta-glycosyltransferase [Magnetofaba australis IT-1]|uniref:Putative beta-glycosyltransferase n=1 Tax=Magnetofaba australis IT-1 TaxID=1434232 RepID=A0A1Y2K461_9PROT|nr:putative beta-glycosyltransferase [Magnetofaba australis IT-1]
MRLIEGPDINSHDAMNKGVAQARGEIIGFLNSDDAYAPSTLLAAMRHFHDNPACLALRVPCLLRESERIVGRILTRIDMGHDANAAWEEYLYGAPAFNAYFFRRALFDRIGLFNVAYVIAADRDFLLRMLAAGIRPHSLCEGAMIYQRHAGSATLAEDETRIIAFLREHLMIAHRLAAGVAPAQQTQLRQWRAHEAHQLGKRLLRRGEFGAAARAAALGWRDGVALARAMRRRAHLTQAYRQLAQSVSAGVAGEREPA